jgi:hypothetical protein
MGSATSGSRSGASARSRTGCTSGRGLRPPRADRSRDGERSRSRTAHRGSSCSRTCGHQAAPLCGSVRATHVHVRTSPCPCGRTSPRVRCVGRTDDMLIVRGVNVFPTAVRDVVGSFAPRVSGHIRLRPSGKGVKQEPPLPVAVELAEGSSRTRTSPRRSVRESAPCSWCRRTWSSCPGGVSSDPSTKASS